MAPSTTLGLSALTALTAASAALAFQSSSPIISTPAATTHHRDVIMSPSCSSPITSSSSARRHNKIPSLALMAHFYPPPPFDPYYNPYYNPYYYYPRPYPPNVRPYTADPRRYSVAFDADAEVIAEADELLNEIQEEEEWITDRERARKQQQQQQGEVINFDPENPAGGRPMKSAAAYPSDMYEDENKFQGRKPGQPVNRGGGGEDPQFKGGSRAPPVVVVDEMTDPREQHVILDDYDNYMNDFFQPPVPPHGPPPPPHQRRSGPSVYTPEEEALIASMGGRGGRPTTQEFAGLGTMMNKKGTAVPSQQYESKMPIDPQQQNYNPEQDFIPPPPPIMPPIPPPPPFAPPGAEEQFLRREEGYLGDSTLKEISLDYSIPIPYLADVLATWGTPVPIDPLARLGDMVTGEQAFAILEAIHTLDIAELHSRYSEDNLMNICDYYDIDIKVAFEFCVGRGWALPFGVRTFLRVEQEEEMLDVLSEVY